VLAGQRLAALKQAGFSKANIYGEASILGGLNVFYLLLDDPQVYGQPPNPQLPERNQIAGSLISAATAVVLGLSALIAFRQRRNTQATPDTTPKEVPDAR